MGALIDDLRSWLDDPDFAWSIGALGAIAEFGRFAGEDAARRDGQRGASIATPRGALRVALVGMERAVAYEELSAHHDRWTMAVDICLPAAEGRMHGRTALTELGSDGDALDPAAKRAPLFDLGLGVANLDACIRTDDESLLKRLRADLGRPLLEPGNRAMTVIKEASPIRVFVSRIARIEVYQRIGSTAKGVPTPPGPHTHLLPQLLASRRIRSATAPLPEGWMPVLTMHPTMFQGHDGTERPFDFERFWRLQDLLERYGPPGYLEEKRRIAEAVKRGVDPADYEPADSRARRLAARIALRQLPFVDAKLDVAPWRARFDRCGNAHGGTPH